jgi:haloacetate dehalogenase
MPGTADPIERTVTIDGADLHVTTLGDSGPAVLLLHGFPQTHLAWRRVAPALANSAQVVCPDLPGYGASGPPAGGDEPAAYAKRRTAATMVDLMRELGHDRFAVIGHDRGALVALRAGLDHPDIVTHVGALDIIPTVDNWAALSGVAGVFAFHLYLLAQPSTLPERMIGADPDLFFGHFLDTWVKQPDAIGADTRAGYLAACHDSDVIHAICQDYRASAFIDGEHDAADRDAGRRLTMPALAMWQDPGETPLPFDPHQIWHSWTDDLHTEVLGCGHFLPEEQPERVAAAIRDLLER